MGGTITWILRDCTFVIALLAVGGYWKWYRWWLTSYSRYRMILLVSVAGLTFIPSLKHWIHYTPGDESGPVLDWIDSIARAGVLIVVSYMLWRVVTLNIHRARDPSRSIEDGRKYLKHTPWATVEETEKLVALWDEMHGRQDHSAASGNVTETGDDPADGHL